MLYITKAYVKYVTPGAGPSLAIGTLIEQTCLLGDATYKISRPYDLRQTDFFMCVLYISLCKICYPRGGVIFGA